MNNFSLGRQIYTRIAEIIFARQIFYAYDVSRLIQITLLLMKIDENNRNITIKLVRKHCSGYIRARILNKNNIIDILKELIQINEEQNQNPNNVLHADLMTIIRRRLGHLSYYNRYNNNRQRNNNRNRNRN